MSTVRPFRFGIFLSDAADPAEWRRLSRKAEDLGYSVLLVPDHVVTPFSPSIALLAAADATTHLRVGGFVFNNDFRHPVFLAKEAATLDVLSGGRFELGVGAGWNSSEYAHAGIPFQPHSVRVERMVEGLQIVKGLFGQEPVTFTGRHYQVQELQGLPKPVQRPYPPITIGGGGKKMLSIAAREADVVSLSPRVGADGRPDPSSYTREGTAEKIGWIREAAGPRFESLELNVYLLAPVMITADRQAVANHMVAKRRSSAPQSTLTEDLVLNSPHFLVGSVDQIVDDLVAQRDELGVSYVAVGRDGEADMDAFAPVVARLAGR
jgi:probable F420-dependent oxidoreductase